MLLFADDQILIANDEYDITYMARKLKEEYLKWGLKLNINKTEYMCIADSSNDIQLQHSSLLRLQIPEQYHNSRRN